MIRILSKGMITQHIIPELSKARRGYVSRVPLWEIVNAILYKFKTGVHGVARRWHLLPCKSLISSNQVKYGAIYYHYRKWARADAARMAVGSGHGSGCFKRTNTS